MSRLFAFYPRATIGAICLTAALGVATPGMAVRMSGIPDLSLNEIPLNDQQAKNLISGAWKESRHQNTVRTEIQITFASDGTFASQVTVTDGADQTEFEATGTWTVENGYLVFREDNPSAPAPNPVTRNRIVKLDALQFTYESPEGTILTMYRSDG